MTDSPNAKVMSSLGICAETAPNTRQARSGVARGPYGTDPKGALLARASRLTDPRKEADSFDRLTRIQRETLGDSK